MQRAPAVDAMIVGEPEDAVLALADLDSLDDADRVPAVIFRRGSELIPHRARGTFDGFLDMPFPAWNLLPLGGYRLPLVTKPYLLVETSRGCPYSCDFCVVPYFHGHKFRERSAKRLVDDIERGHRQPQEAQVGAAGQVRRAQQGGPALRRREGLQAAG